jgi:4-hydroxybenzoate polyprenyltransferase
MHASLRKLRKNLQKLSGYDCQMMSKPLALLASSHPGPTVVVTLVEAGLGFAVGLDVVRLLLITGCMLACQLSIGLSNDWLDAERDRAVGRTDKPVTRGDIRVTTVRSAAWIALAIAFILCVPLGPYALLALVVIVAPAWGYNLGLKNTAASLLAYLVSFGTLPALATLSLAHPHFPTVWAVVVGALLGGAAHFANVLPDLDDDRTTGISGFPHRIGRTASAVTTYVLLLAASLLEVVGAGGFGFVPGNVALGFSVVIAGIGIGIARRRTRWHFRFILIAALVDVVALVFAGSHLIAAAV